MLTIRANDVDGDGRVIGRFPKDFVPLLYGDFSIPDHLLRYDTFAIGDFSYSRTITTIVERDRDNNIVDRDYQVNWLAEYVTDRVFSLNWNATEPIYYNSEFSLHFDPVKFSYSGSYISEDYPDDIYIGPSGDLRKTLILMDYTFYGSSSNDDIYFYDWWDGQSFGDGIAFAGDGDDVLRGGFGSETLYGGPGNDYIEGGAGVNILYGEDGDDLLIGSADWFGEKFLGGLGDDHISAYSFDFIDGDSGDDEIYLIYDYRTQFAELDGTTVMAGAGDDYIEVRAPSISDLQISGGSGNDRFKIDFSSNEKSIFISSPSRLFEYLNSTIVEFELLFAKLTFFDDIVDLRGVDLVKDNFSIYTIDLGAGHNEIYIDSTTVGTFSITNLVNTYLYSYENNLFADFSQSSEGISIGLSVSAKNLSLSLSRIQFIDAVGGSGDDVFYAVGDSNHIDGGVGNDAIFGMGFYFYGYEEIGDRFLGGDGNDTIYDANGGNAYIDGGRGNDVIRLAAADETVLGGDGDDEIRVNGIYGSDSLDGGSGDDRIVFSGSRANFQFESISATEWRVVDLRSSQFGDMRVTNVEWVVFSEGAFLVSDLLPPVYGTITGTNGNNTLNGTSGRDKIEGLGGDDLLKGLAGEDLLIGGSGNDRLDGGTAADIMRGGSGNDSYTVDMVGDVVDETTEFGADAGGEDNISASVSFVLTGLASFVETLTLTGSASIDGTGNALANRITGNSGANVLSGDAGHDKISGGAGTDELFGGTENDTLAGGSENDILDGGSGNDILNGESGADTMRGGSGNDSYTVDSTSDVVDETNGWGGDAGGNDAVSASVSFALVGLAAFVEKLTLTGSAAINGTGNALVNTITGNSASNVLVGDAGNDKLSGGAGTDRLIGGRGNDNLKGGADADVFVFSRAGVENGIDKISDFVSGVDRIEVSAFDYAGLTAESPLGAAKLTLGTTAVGSSAQFVYDTAKRSLLWDSDGAGGSSATAIASFNTGVVLSISDFIIT